MLVILRNLVSVARRFRLALTLNILGLSVAFAAFMVIMIQLDYDYGFDKFHKDYDKIFRLEMYIPNLSPTRVPVFPRPLAERFFESSPHIVGGALTTHAMSSFMGSEAYFYVESNDGARNYFKEKSVNVTPEFFEIFTFDFVEGSTNVYIAPENVIIPLSLARRLFGNEPAVGKQIVYGGRGNQTVLAVYRDFPKYTFVENCLYFAIPPDENKDNWDWHKMIYTAFIRINDASNASSLIDNFSRNLDMPDFISDDADIEFYLTALTDIHFLPDMQYDFLPRASKQTLLIFITIAIVIIAIAAINFTNFSTALTPMRIKSINTQHVLGLRRSKIRFALVFEAVSICFASYLVALLLVDLFKNTPMAQLVDGDLAYAANPFIFFGTALVAIFTGIFAGLYPSRYMTSFEPAFVLKGSFALSPKGRKLRNTLISVQFVASFALIIGALFMLLQNRFMQNSNLGYQKDNIITVEMSRIRNNIDAFTNQIKAYSGVDDVTYGTWVLSSSDVYSRLGTQYRGEGITFQVIPVHYTFFDVMGIEITEGRSFRQEDENAEYGVFVFNESARKQFGFDLNTSLDDWRGAEIIGFMPDIKVASFRMAVEPTAFLVTSDYNRFGGLNYAYIKLNRGARTRDALSHINATLAGYDSDYPFEVHFFDEVIQRLYEKERALSSLISLFSILAIFISIVGVFGLVVFDSECRRKEIGIRKVLGASTLEIIIMFNKAYFKILFICFVIASPLAWYAVTRWLENFAYKTPMYWWVYLLALVAVGAITVCTVTFQNWRVANDDPVKSIKTE